MKVICAPDSFKESLTATQGAQAMKRGVLRVVPDATVDLCPIADGGDGTVDAMLAATGGQRMTSQVQGPLAEPLGADWGMFEAAERTAVIEMAAASGLALVPIKQRDPRETSTFGTGQLIAAALDAGAKTIILGIGGSATNDGGCGMAQALGAVFLNASGEPIEKPFVGKRLSDIARIDLSALDARLSQTRVTVACDVNNPLTGPNGAAAIYGPQKGATPPIVEFLDAGLVNLAQHMRADLDKDVQTTRGVGAAGGLGGGLVAFLGAILKPGVSMVLDAVDFDTRVRGCDLCLTGEGRIDGQSLSGKACLGVAQAAGLHGVETIALVGKTGPGAEATLEHGLASYHPISEGLPLDEAIRRASELLEETTARVLRTRFVE